MKKTFSLVGLTLIITLIIAFSSACRSKQTEETVDVTLTSGTTTKTATTATTATFNYSEGIAENGFWKGVNAMDYVKLCQYKGIHVPSGVHNITEEAVDKEVENLLADYVTESQIKDRAVVNGDTVNIDYVGSINGVEFEGGSTKGAGTDVTIGVTQYIDDFLQQLIGHLPGETFNVEVTFPEDYGVAELNGKDAVFVTTINYIVEKVYPELTDEFVETNLSSSYGWRTVDSMKTEIREEMKSQAVSSYLQNYIVENSSISSIPEAMIKYQENSMLNYYQNYAGYAGMDLETFLKSYMGISSVAELVEKNRERIINAASLGLVLQAIAEDASLTVNEADVVAYLEDYAGVTDYTAYKEHFGMPYLYMVTLNKKVMDYLAENAVLE